MLKPFLTILIVLSALTAVATLEPDTAQAATPNVLSADCAHSTRAHPAPIANCTFIPVDVDALIRQHSLSFRDATGAVRTYRSWHGVWGFVTHRAPRCTTGGHTVDLKSCWTADEPGIGPSFTLSDGTSITARLFAER